MDGLFPTPSSFKNLECPPRQVWISDQKSSMKTCPATTPNESGICLIPWKSPDDGLQTGRGVHTTEQATHTGGILPTQSRLWGKTGIWDHAIELKPGAPATIPGKIYTLTQSEQKALEEFVKEHLVKGYIKPSKSPYASPFFFIKKKDGKLRPVQDYRKVNEWTIKNHYPLPLIPELIAQVKGASLFTKFNIRWGYNNVRIKEGDQWKAAFITNQGLFEPNVMFFGLTNSPATF